MNITKFIFTHHIPRFLVSGGVATLTNLIILYFFTETVGFHYLLSGVIAFFGSLVVSFLMQKHWTFRDHTTKNTHKKFAAFLTVALVNLLINVGLLYFFTDFCGVHYIISQIITSAIIACLSYFLYKMIFTDKGVVPMV